MRVYGMTKTKRIHLSLPAELVKKLDNACKKRHMTRSEAIKRILIVILQKKIIIKENYY